MKLKILFLHLILSLLCASVVFAQSDLILQNLRYEVISSKEIHVMLDFSNRAIRPDSFSMDEPATIVLDFPKVLLGLAPEHENQIFESNILKTISVVETDEKTRIVFGIEKLVPFSTQIQGNTLVVKLMDTVTSMRVEPPAKPESDAFQHTIEGLDFRRGKKGEGLLVLKLTDPTLSVDFKEEYERIWVTFLKAKVKENLIRRFNVVDFGTPVQAVSVRQEEDQVSVEIEAIGEYEKIAYQVDEEFIVELRPISDEEREAKLAEQFKYTGERLSFNAKAMDVREALRQLADFTGLNIVISDNITGTITLRLQNVPWDQALDMILKSKGLSKKEEDNVILVGLSSEMSAQDQLALEVSKQQEALAPIRSEMIQINYAQAKTFVDLFKEEGSSFLSSRGKVSVDERTNMLLVQDTDEKIREIETLIKTLDVPIKQVMIEAQIVESTNNLSDALGIRFGGASSISAGSRKIGIAGSPVSTTGGIDNATASTAGAAAASIAGGSGLSRGLFFDGAQTDTVGRLGLSIARLPGGTLLDLELQAQEVEVKSKVLARPRLMTLDKQTATMEAGEEVPYQTSTGEGGTTTTEFKDALTRLEVTPQITPDDKILLKIIVTKDTPGGVVAEGSTLLKLNKKRLETKVLVDNGETIVLGGLFEVNQSKTKTKVPILGDIPFIGRLFRSNTSTNNRSETLIFITPRIVREG